VVPLETFPSLASAVDWAFRRGGTTGTLPRLVAQFDFSTQLFDDRPRTQSIEIPFRFVPNLLHVALALVLGAVLGAALRTALAWRGGRSGVRGAARRVVVGALGAIVAGLVGGLLVTHDSRFVILGFDLNPLELLPAIVLGILCGFATEKVLVAAGLLKQEA